MPTELIVGNHRIGRDYEMDKIVADWFRARNRDGRRWDLNAERLVIQCGTVDDHYRVHIRFTDLTRPSANNAQPIYFHVNHDMPYGAHATKQQVLQWVLAALPMTLPMAYRGWTEQYKLRWPPGYPVPRTSQ